MSAEVEASDDAKVVTTAAQGPIEIRVGGLVDVNDNTRCEDKLVVNDVVASPSILLREERDTTLICQ